MAARTAEGRHNAAVKAAATRRAARAARGLSVAPRARRSAADRELARYRSLDDANLLAELRAEQERADVAGMSGTRQFVRIDEYGSAITGNTLSGAIATRCQVLALARCERIESELESRGFDRDMLSLIRFDETEYVDERAGLASDVGDTSFDLSEIEAA